MCVCVCVIVYYLMTLCPVLVDVYHKEQLVTKEEAEEVASDVWRWRGVAVTKDDVTTTKIADILDKYGFNDITQRIRGKCVYSHSCVLILYRIPLKGTVILNISCMLHASLVLSVCEYIDHYSKVHVNSYLKDFFVYSMY